MILTSAMALFWYIFIVSTIGITRYHVMAVLVRLKKQTSRLFFFVMRNVLFWIVVHLKNQTRGRLSWRGICHFSDGYTITHLSYSEGVRLLHRWGSTLCFRNTNTKLSWWSSRISHKFRSTRHPYPVLWGKMAVSVICSCTLKGSPSGPATLLVSLSCHTCLNMTLPGQCGAIGRVHEIRFAVLVS